MVISTHITAQTNQLHSITAPSTAQIVLHVLLQHVWSQQEYEIVYNWNTVNTEQLKLNTYGGKSPGYSN